MGRKSNCREILLDAAEAVVLESGSAHLTLEAVAEKAAISKGGLLYHFPNKEALLEGLIIRLHTRFENVRSELKAEFSGDPAGPLRAFVLAAFHEQAQQKRLSAALLAIAANNPKLLKSTRSANRRNFRQLAQGKAGFARSMIIVLATHGLWLLEVLETSPFTAKERATIFKSLLDLAGKKCLLT